jgi:hypothetical protein
MVHPPPWRVERGSGAMALRMVRVADLREGDLIDLEGDQYADRHGAGNHCGCENGICASEVFPYEFARVEETEQETAGCIRVDTNLGSFGFPPEHEVPVSRGSD